MTNAIMNTQLYAKMYAEQKQYWVWLLIQPPNEILNHICEHFQNQEYGEMEQMGRTIETCANKIMRGEFSDPRQAER